MFRRDSWRLRVFSVCAGKKLRRNFAAETIAKRSRAFEQYLSHLRSVAVLRGALCVRQFFYLPDLQAGQMFIRSVTLEAERVEKLHMLRSTAHAQGCRDTQG